MPLLRTAAGTLFLAHHKQGIRKLPCWTKRVSAVRVVPRVRRTVPSIEKADAYTCGKFHGAASNWWVSEGMESVPRNCDRGTFLRGWGESTRYQRSGGREGEVQPQSSRRGLP